MADDLKIHLLTKPADRWVAVHIAHPWALKTDCSQGVQWLHIASVWATWLHSEPLYWVHLWIYRIIQRRLLDDIYCGCWPWTVSKMLKHDAPNLVSNSYVLIKCECQRAAALITTTKLTPQDLTADRKINKQTNKSLHRIHMTANLCKCTNYGLGIQRYSLELSYEFSTFFFWSEEPVILHLFQKMS